MVVQNDDVHSALNDAITYQACKPGILRPKLPPTHQLCSMSNERKDEQSIRVHSK